MPACVLPRAPLWGRLPRRGRFVSSLLHLDLIFDINKTIIMEDPGWWLRYLTFRDRSFMLSSPAAGGKNARQLVNEVISEVAWGEECAIVGRLEGQS
jgi:hypothetical protein